MNARPDLEQRLTDFYHGEAPRRAPDRVLHAALASVETTQQRRALIRVPRRFQPMSNFARAAVAVTAVVVVGAIGLALVGPFRQPSTGVAGVATPAPSASQARSLPPSPTSSPAASPSASPLAPLTGSFTSDVYGFSTSYAAGWKVQRATELWKTGVPWPCVMTCSDVIYESEQDSPFFSVAAQPVGPKAEWMSAMIADPGWEGTCRAVTMPIDIDHTAGTLAKTCPDGMLFAVTTSHDRGYVFILYRIDDVNKFKQILATVRLNSDKLVTVMPSVRPSASASG